MEYENKILCALHSLLTMYFLRSDSSWQIETKSPGRDKVSSRDIHGVRSTVLGTHLYF